MLCSKKRHFLQVISEQSWAVWLLMCNQRFKISIIKEPQKYQGPKWRNCVTQRHSGIQNFEASNTTLMKNWHGTGDVANFWRTTLTLEKCLDFPARTSLCWTKTTQTLVIVSWMRELGSWGPDVEWSWARARWSWNHIWLRATGQEDCTKIIIPTIFCTVKQQRHDFQCVMPIHL